MNTQLELFTNEKQILEQKKMLNMLIDFKRTEIEEEIFKNFYGTAEEIQLKRKEVDKKVVNFTEKVIAAFPGIL